MVASYLLLSQLYSSILTSLLKKTLISSLYIFSRLGATEVKVTIMW